MHGSGVRISPAAPIFSLQIKSLANRASAPKAGGFRPLARNTPNLFSISRRDARRCARKWKRPPINEDRRALTRYQWDRLARQARDPTRHRGARQVGRVYRGIRHRPMRDRGHLSQIACESGDEGWAGGERRTRPLVPVQATPTRGRRGQATAEARGTFFCAAALAHNPAAVDSGPPLPGKRTRT